MDQDQNKQRVVLVVEDEKDIRDVIEWNLKRAKYRVVTADNGEDALRIIQSNDDIYLVLLDIMLPKLSGIALCSKLRAEDKTVDLPIIMLTALGEDSDIIKGLEAGADDYITKPFSPRELIARVNAILRRVNRKNTIHETGLPILTVADVVIDPNLHDVLIAGRRVHFTKTEFRILYVLMSNTKKVHSRDGLIEAAMGHNAWISDRTIDVHIRAIRRKLGSQIDLIETIRGVGYRGKAVV